jgi:predicted enzyme related to lactoylglutathione lyase
MKRVIGIGGIFFKSKDPKALGDWYQKYLGITNEGWGAQFQLKDLNGVKEVYQIWSPFKAETTYFEPSTQPFMINFIVDDLTALLDQLKQEGVNVMDKTDESEFGKFGWCMDPEGNKIELWEPPR